LIHRLLRHPNWALVYYDEVAVVFVREKSNDDLVLRAHQRFGQLNEDFEHDLEPPVSSWQWPVGHVTELSSYAAIVDLFGRSDAATGYCARMLNFDLPRNLEAEVRVRLAYHHARRGEFADARAQRRLAERADPHNPWIKQLREGIGS
jgi:hypothetical protein